MIVKATDQDSNQWLVYTRDGEPVQRVRWFDIHTGQYSTFATNPNAWTPDVIEHEPDGSWVWNAKWGDPPLNE